MALIARLMAILRPVMAAWNLAGRGWLRTFSFVCVGEKDRESDPLASLAYEANLGLLQPGN